MYKNLLLIIISVLIINIIIYNIIKEQEGFDINDLTRDINNITSDIAKIPDKMTNISNTLDNKITNTTNSLDNKITNTTNTLDNKITNTTNTLDNKITNTTNSLTNKINDLTSKVSSIDTYFKNMSDQFDIAGKYFNNIFIQLGNIFIQIGDIFQSIGFYLNKCMLNGMIQGTFDSLNTFYLLITPKFMRETLSKIYNYTLKYVVDFIGYITGYTDRFNKCKNAFADEVQKLNKTAGSMRYSGNKFISHIGDAFKGKAVTDNDKKSLITDSNSITDNKNTNKNSVLLYFENYF